MKSILGDDLFVPQAEQGECGLACLAMVARHYGDRSDLSALRRRFGSSSRGASFSDLRRFADQLGFSSRGIKTDAASLGALTLPAILHWNMNHFVVLKEVKEGIRRRFLILDPADGEKALSQDDLSRHYTGVCLELVLTPNFRPGKRRERLRLSQLWKGMRGLPSSLSKILALSLLVQILTLVSPFFMQAAVDSALPSMDYEFLGMLAFGFAGVAVITALFDAARARLSTKLAHEFSYQVATGMYRHTSFLPLKWYERRHLGDIISRFGSLNPISDFLSRTVTAVALDALMAVVCIVIMIVYSPIMTFVSASAALLYALLKFVFLHAMKLANANVLSAQAHESSVFIENMRGALSIKMFCQESARTNHWQNKKAKFTQASYKLAKITGDFDAINAFIVAVETVLFIYIAIRLVMNGALTLGMVLAFQIFRANFIGSAVRVIDQAVLYRLLGVHLGRLSDIALEARESEKLVREVIPPVKLDFVDVSFSYGEGQRNVIDRVTFSLRMTELTAISGPSGAGKTTLVKLMCGLLEPTSGKILADGVPLAEYGYRTYRNHFGVVNQEDVLFAGTIAQNVAFFDPDCDFDRLIRCCRQAEIHQDVMSMPMKYDSLIGDMGSSLSGGQRQRLLLARALYKAPTFLLLDEGTAHLDPDVEAVVVERLKQRVGGVWFVTHRESIVGQAKQRITVSKDGVALAVDPAL